MEELAGKSRVSAWPGLIHVIFTRPNFPPPTVVITVVLTNTLALPQEGNFRKVAAAGRYFP